MTEPITNGNFTIDNNNKNEISWRINGRKDILRPALIITIYVIVATYLVNPIMQLLSMPDYGADYFAYGLIAVLVILFVFMFIRPAIKIIRSVSKTSICLNTEKLTIKKLLFNKTYDTDKIQTISISSGKLFSQINPFLLKLVGADQSLTSQSKTILILKAIMKNGEKKKIAEWVENNQFDARQIQVFLTESINRILKEQKA